MSPGAARLLDDWRVHRISRWEFVQGVYALWPEKPFPQRARYAVAAPSTLDVVTLAGEVQQEVPRLTAKERAALDAATAATRPRLSPSADGDRRGSAQSVSAPSCQSGAFTPVQTCTVTTEHFVIVYYVGQAANAVASDSPGVVPSLIAGTANHLEAARAVFAQYGFDLPGDGLTFRVGDNPAGGLSLPALPGFTSQTTLTNDFDSSYLPVHELFHHVQYRYSTVGALAGAQSFMEASAEWAAERYLDTTAIGVPYRTLYARGVPSFLATSSSRLDSWDGPAQPRQYGGVAYVDYLSERLGEDFVLRVWQQMGQYPVRVNEPEAIATVLQSYQTSMADELGALWFTLYAMCGQRAASFAALRHDESVRVTSAFLATTNATTTAPTPPVTFQEQTDQWCLDHVNNRSESPAERDRPGVTALRTTSGPGAGTYRPPHAIGQIVDTVTETSVRDVDAGGAIFTDLAGPADDLTHVVTITAGTDNGAFHGRLAAWSWNSNPADVCSWTQSEQMAAANAATVVASTSPWCRNLTVIVVNTDTVNGFASHTTTGWTARPTTATLTNSSHNLTVTDASRVGDWVRGALGDGTGADLCGQGDELGGWKATLYRDTTSAEVYADWNGSSPVLAFTATGTHATSTVGDAGFAVTHDCHPAGSGGFACDVRFHGVGPHDVVHYTRGVHVTPVTASWQWTYRRSSISMPAPGPTAIVPGGVLTIDAANDRADPDYGTDSQLDPSTPSQAPFANHLTTGVHYGVTYIVGASATTSPVFAVTYTAGDLATVQSDLNGTIASAIIRTGDPFEPDPPDPTNFIPQPADATAYGIGIVPR